MMRSDIALMCLYQRWKASPRFIRSLGREFHHHQNKLNVSTLMIHPKRLMHFPSRQTQQCNFLFPRWQTQSPLKFKRLYQTSAIFSEDFGSNGRPALGTTDMHPLSTRDMPSALFIRRDDQQNVAVYDIDLDLDNRLSDLETLYDNVHRRQLRDSVDVDTLVSKFKSFSKLKEEEESLEAEKETIAKEMKIIVKRKDESNAVEDRKKSLIKRGKEIREKLRKLQKDLIDLEAIVMFMGLKLPTDLLPSTPNQDVVLEEHNIPTGRQHQTESQKDLYERAKHVSFSTLSPGAYFLTGPLAELELELVHDFTKALKDAGLDLVSCPDMAKTVVMEGCGEDFTDPDKVLSLQLKAADLEAYVARGGDKNDLNKWDIMLHLCGGASLPAVVSFFCKMNIASDSLPVRWQSVGRNYKPVPDASVQEDGLLAVPQSTQVSLFGVERCPDRCEDLYREYVSILWTIYTSLGLPVRLVKAGAPSLLRSQAARTDVETWIPSQQKYIKIADVGVLSDYVSRRLMIKCSDDVNDIYNRNFVHMVYGTAFNIPNLIAALLEKGTFKGQKMPA